MSSVIVYVSHYISFPLFCDLFFSLSCSCSLPKTHFCFCSDLAVVYFRGFNSDPNPIMLVTIILYIYAFIIILFNALITKHTILVGQSIFLGTLVLNWCVKSFGLAKFYFHIFIFHCLLNDTCFAYYKILLLLFYCHVFILYFECSLPTPISRTLQWVSNHIFQVVIVFGYQCLVVCRTQCIYVMWCQWGVYPTFFIFLSTFQNFF